MTYSIGSLGSYRTGIGYHQSLVLSKYSSLLADTLRFLSFYFIYTTNMSTHRVHNGSISIPPTYFGVYIIIIIIIIGNYNPTNGLKRVTI